jgi:hypothetical protein
VRVTHHRDEIGWWSTSPEVAGWYATGDTYVEVHRFAEDSLALILGSEVEVVHEVVP